MTVIESMRSFAAAHGRSITVGGVTWRYCRLGQGSPVLWLTGGLRRAAFGFPFLQELARCHTVLAPDYPPVETILECLDAFDALLRAEGLERVALAGQSYGGMLAQAYLAHRPQAVERLILSSSGPFTYGRAWLPVEYFFILLARLLPERTVKRLLAGTLAKILTVPAAERAQWLEALDEVLNAELTRQDVVSHFAVAADVIRRGTLTSSALRSWTGRIVILSAPDDPTQNKSDLPQYQALFGRAVEWIDVGTMGHTGALLDPARYAEIVEQALQ